VTKRKENPTYGREPVLDRLAANMEVEGECWVWTRYRNARGGYGRISVGGRLATTHRSAYELLVGPIPEGMTLDHLCRNTACFNPDHLEIVTVAENIRRGTQGWNMRIRTHCPRGHEYTPETTWIGNKNDRHCRACAREKARERRARAAA
jgi:hypothetical protein